MKRVAFGVLAFVVLAGCAKGRDAGSVEARAGAGDAGPPFDVETMAFLSEARALHHEANVDEQGSDLRGAIAAVARITTAARPHAGPAAPEVEEVVADAFARLAELELRAGDLASAARHAEEGLGHAPRASYFRGHLLEVAGIVDEARSASLADAGDATAAREARARAMKALEEAVSVQERVIAQALGDGGLEGGGP